LIGPLLGREGGGEKKKGAGEFNIHTYTNIYTHIHISTHIYPTGSVFLESSPD
jgi:hypothetical protein